eukprot:Gregarina_sp_Poly_1__10010@NODE_669_length_6853_cov_407_081344_g505_i0_p1_GENE_NODE_669_length_6853_cov_407_081344_g505_i0NODE_669_length_6853_cov_407_081344_g505_i0_p1_ORF_typecomplete_len1232_score187_84Glyco_transf_20/PF00982_21/3_7e131Trehalose_PPase/PF02358_16/6_3e62CBM_20/PF00686_19/5_7e15Hydrolase_3/PF08282_12/3_5e03Hydrolase_3/PF08282_12/1_3e06Glycos_transf_1/PF00534_20/0_0024TMF_DNA_bd/PF12329_8/0_99TMF_DNA_bd/PF12329_8/7e02_NODE_669_length_6853_cov_407_081344_g505_i015745269
MWTPSVLHQRPASAEGWRPEALHGLPKQDDNQGAGGNVLIPPTVKDATYFVRVYFRVAINTAFGQQVYVVGGWPKLGDWDPRKGWALTTTDEVFPVWFSREPLYLPLKHPIYYQYVVVQEQTGTVVSWDSSNGATQRKIIPTGYEMTIEDDEGLYRALTSGPSARSRHPLSMGNLRSPLYRARDQQVGSIDVDLPTRPNSNTACPVEAGKEIRPLQSIEEIIDSATGGKSNETDSRLPLVRDQNSESPQSFPKVADALQSDRLMSPPILTCPDSPGIVRELAKSPGQTHEHTPDSLAAQNVSGSPLSAQQQEALEIIRKLRASEGEPRLTPEDTLLVITFELPVRIRKKKDVPSNAVPEESHYEVFESNALLMPGLHKLRGNFGCSVRFIGYPGMSASSEEEKDLMSHLLGAYDCIPVFVSPEELDAFVDFCHKFLSPLFHSVVDLDGSTQEPFSTKNWMIYQAMNKLWANAALQHYSRDDDLIWIHDYQLLLVPQYIARKYKRANIGLFLHCPFPSSDLFRCLPVREEILRGMLCADLVGFHFFEYARHFFVANKRLLGLDHQFTLGGFLGIEYAGRNISIKICHVNVEYQELRKELSLRQDIRQLAQKIRDDYKGKFIFGAIDRCDQLAGLSLKLRAFRKFLQNFSYARNKVVLIQLCYPGRGSMASLRKLTNEFTMMVNRINTEFESHVELEIRPVPPHEKHALLQAIDCLLDTSVRDGLNLLAFEYIGCRPDKPSHLILSEFTGCSRAIATAVRINPWQIEEVANTMDRVVSTSPETLRERWNRDQLYLSQHSLTQWAREFLGDLQRAKKTQSKVYLQYGFASKFRVLTWDADFKPLNPNEIVKSYRHANRRLLFFDHEGTLAPDRRHLTLLSGHDNLSALGSPPSTAVKEALTVLADDPNNTVVIFSGRDRKCMEEWFGDIPRIGLCAEHGFYAKIPAVTGNQWSCMSTNEDFTWKTIALELMMQYTKRTQGSFIENKGSALVFQYRDADPDFGSWQAKELATYLEEFLFGLPVSVVAGKGYVEAKLRGVNKGTAVEHVILSMKSLFGEAQFILCIGDDRSDEAMFAVVNAVDKDEQALKDHEPSEGTIARQPILTKHTNLASVATSVAGSDDVETDSSRGLAVYTVTIGKKPSEAKYYCTDTDEVSELLNTLKNQTTHHETKFDPQSLVEGILRASSRDDPNAFDTDIIGLGKNEFSLNSVSGISPIDDQQVGGNSWPGSLLLQL